MANFSKILGLASTAVVFAGTAFGQATVSGGSASQTPLVRVEGTTELVGEYSFTVSAAATVNILDILSLPVTSKVVQTSGTAYTEAVAVVNGVAYQGTVTGSQVSFSGVVIPAGGAVVTIANIRVNATSLTVGSGTPPAITESAFVSGVGVNSAVTTSTPVAYAFTGLGASTLYKSFPFTSSTSKGNNALLVCQGYKTGAGTKATGLLTVIDIGENFATAFKGQGSSTNSTLGSEFTNNTETGYVPTFTNVTSGVTNIASSATLLQVVFSNVPASVTLYVPVTIAADQTTTVAPVVTAGTLTLVASPSNLTTASASTSSSAPGNLGTNTGYSALTVASGSATAYYLFTPGANSSSTTESFAISVYDVQSANVVAASATALTAAVSFAPVGSSQIPNFVVGPSTTTSTVGTFTQCTTSLLFPFVTNQLGFDTGIAIANTSSDPFGSNGATAQAGTCAINFYGAGAPSPSNVTTPSVPSGTVYTAVLSGIGAGFQGYLIAQCNFQYAHGFAFITDGVGANGGLSQGYLAGVIPDTNQVSRGTANPIGSVTSTGTGETLGN
jgi:hypothetical protein